MPLKKCLHRWLIIELNEAYEDTSFTDIETAILSVFGDVEYFIPIFHEQMGSYTSNSVLMEGYAFVKDNTENRQNINNLRDTRVFSGALCMNGRYQTLSSETVTSLKKKLRVSVKKKFNIGTKVCILDGVFKNLWGEVISVEENGKRIVVKIVMKSREIIAPIPSTLLSCKRQNKD